MDTEQILELEYQIKASSWKNQETISTKKYVKIKTWNIETKVIKSYSESPRKKETFEKIMTKNILTVRAGKD